MDLDWETNLSWQVQQNVLTFSTGKCRNSLISLKLVGYADDMSIDPLCHSSAQRN